MVRHDISVTSRLAVVAVPAVDMAGWVISLSGPQLSWRRLSICADAAAVVGQSAPAVVSHAAVVTCSALLKIETTSWDSQQYCEIDMNVVRMLSASVLRKIADDAGRWYNIMARHDIPVTGRLATVAAQFVDMARLKRWVISLSGASIVMVPAVDMRWGTSCCRIERAGCGESCCSCYKIPVRRDDASYWLGFYCPSIVIIILLPWNWRDEFWRFLLKQLNNCERSMQVHWPIVAF